VHRDPPHLLKNARNFLEKADVVIPDTWGKAKWQHIAEFYKLDAVNSLRLSHKLSPQHISNLRFPTKMKVVLAANVLSNSVSAGIDACVASNLMEAGAAATSAYIKLFNDLFDVLNSSSPKDKTPFRRPLLLQSKSIIFLKDCKEWLTKLQELNSSRKPRFIRGWIQSINVVLELQNTLTAQNLPYLSTRNLCQDPLELFFGKVRLICKFPDAHGFAYSYARLATASMIRAPLTGNCEHFDDHLQDTVGLMTVVSINKY
jgi:hypothetical protein